jgi:hypothetical protein
MTQENLHDLTLFIDESGSRKPNPKDSALFFAMGGVLLKRTDEDKVESYLRAFKERWQIPHEIPLHGCEIRSRKKNFKWLGKLTQEEQGRFLEDLTATIIQCPVIVHAQSLFRNLW